MTDQSPSFFLPDAAWLNPPPDCHLDSDKVLNATSGAKTDFWRTTHYGFIRDDGHALLTRRTEDFTATLTFAGKYEALYDQAGLMIRSGPDRWVKFGVEFTDGIPNLSCVVTHRISDWSARPAPEALDGPITIRATLMGDALLMQSSVSGSDGVWQMERLAPWPTDVTEAYIGPYLCSPERSGFEAQFLRCRISAPEVRDLHA